MRKMTLIRCGVASVLLGGVVAGGMFAVGCGGDDNSGWPGGGDDSGADVTTQPSPGDDGCPGGDGRREDRPGRWRRGQPPAPSRQGHPRSRVGLSLRPALLLRLRERRPTAATPAPCIDTDIVAAPNTALGVPPGTGGPAAADLGRISRTGPSKSTASTPRPVSPARCHRRRGAAPSSLATSSSAPRPSPPTPAAPLHRSCEPTTGTSASFPPGRSPTAQRRCSPSPAARRARPTGDLAARRVPVGATTPPRAISVSGPPSSTRRRRSTAARSGPSSPTRRIRFSQVSGSGWRRRDRRASTSNTTQLRAGCAADAGDRGRRGGRAAAP